MSRGSGFPEAKRALPRWSDSKTSAGVNPACSALSVARSRRCGVETGAVVEQPVNVSRTNRAAAERRFRGRFIQFLSLAGPVSQFKNFAQGEEHHLKRRERRSQSGARVVIRIYHCRRSLIAARISATTFAFRFAPTL